MTSLTAASNSFLRSREAIMPRPVLRDFSGWSVMVLLECVVAAVGLLQCQCVGATAKYTVLPAGFLNSQIMSWLFDCL